MVKPDNKSNPRNLTYEQGLKLIIEFFQGDKDKALKWYMTKNPLLGDMSPYEMIKIGRGKKLMQFITCQLEGNHP